MTSDIPRFLPDRLRPQRPSRRSRRGLVLLSVVPFMLLAVPFWRIDDVRVDGCSRLPQPAVESLQELVGQPALGLDVASVKERVEVWPGVGEVQVEFLLPGTVTVRAESARAWASLQVGRNWHGVGADGGLTGLLDEPVRPILEGFSAPGDRRRGLDAAQRIQDASGALVMSVRRITPNDYRVELEPADGTASAVVHVHPQGTVAEGAWCAAFARGSVAQTWADLRWTDRMVIGGGA